MTTPIITRETLIPISAVLIVLSAGFSYGILYNKVSTLTEEVGGLRDDVKEISQNLDQLIGRLTNVSYGGSVTD